MELAEISLKDALALATMFAQKQTDTAFQLGKAYLIRTVTFYYTGRLKQITSKEFVLEEAAWIADTGRFSECLKEGVFNEIEPYKNDVIIPRDSIIDGTLWDHKLPRNVK